MLAIMEKTNQGELTVISSETIVGLRTQIEQVLSSQLNPSLWAQLLNGDTTDCGQYQIVLFDSNSIINVKLKMRTIVNLEVQRDSFSYSHGN